MNVQDDYLDFLRKKVAVAETFGFPCEPADVNPALKPHQVDTVCWCVRGGRRMNASSFGMGKTVEQLEISRLIVLKASLQRLSPETPALDGPPSEPIRALIVTPLGVRHEFVRDALTVLGWPAGPLFVRTLAEVEAAEAAFDRPGPGAHIFLTNYESVRDGKLDPADFTCVCLDEAAVLRGFGGSKTFRELMLLCTGDGGPSGRMRAKRVKYRFVSTATPAPNDYIEILAYSEFLGIMDISQAKTRFFRRDPTKADNLTLHPHKEAEFWLWVSSWALFVTRPSDLGHSDDGYEFPALDVHWHEVSSDHSRAGTEKSGQHRLFSNAAIGVSEAAAERRHSLAGRLAKLTELRTARPTDHVVIWHDLEDERRAIQESLPDAVSVWGTQDLDERETRIVGFSDGEFATLSTKPQIAGAGTNLQRHCHWAVFFGIGFKFYLFIQALHRLQRFGQKHPVRVDIIYTEAEREIRTALERKWSQHNQMVKRMTKIIREYGLSAAAMAQTLGRSLGVERVEIDDPTPGKKYRLVNNDCVDETRRMAADSVHLVATSIPFSTQYEYSPNYADFGHSSGNEEFFRQMDFLTPELLRILQPGRIAAIHVKDRIVPGGMTNLGFQTVYPFHCRCIEHYVKNGFAYIGMVTVVTDVVRENNQTYRLSWSRQCQDATCMSVGMPEYILLFRKPPTDRSDSFADVPVAKTKADYSLGRWQIDAHAYWRSSGERLLTGDELSALPHASIFKLFKAFSLGEVYDYEHHVKLNEHLEAEGRLPTTFMLLQPQAPAGPLAENVWADVTRMRTLNGSQVHKGKQQHLCPLPFDIVDRIIQRFTMPGETVFDPFGGLMTVPYRAIHHGRVGVGVELNPAYFLDGATYCRAAVAAKAMPSLFDALSAEDGGPDAPVEDMEEAAEPLAGEGSDVSHVIDDSGEDLAALEAPPPVPPATADGLPATSPPPAPDELLPQAIELVTDAGRVSVILLQRRLGVGYARALRIIQQIRDSGLDLPTAAEQAVTA